jgi:hypothetical protein
MVERVARAWVAESTGCRGSNVPCCDGCECIRGARAAIAVMREPTEAMIAALLRDKFLDATDHNRDAITLDWQTMLDAALKE